MGLAGAGYADRAEDAATVFTNPAFRPGDPLRLVGKRDSRGAYELAWSGDIDMGVARGPLAGRVSGTYEDAALHVVTLGIEWRL